MALDHSITYKKVGLKNILHKRRLRKILRILDSLNIDSTSTYLDIGCSNGYLTELIASKYEFKLSKGLDHNNENLDIARNKYKDLKFDYIDLNKPSKEQDDKYDVITCFETLEHVGNLNNAIKQILSYGKGDNSAILINVPIEIGFWGIIKFIIKMLYGYDLKELDSNLKTLTYFKSLITFKNISKYRDNRGGWGTHFGFDYREVDKILIKNNHSYLSKNYGSTRFYLINNKTDKI